jgi:hypothetical protein
LLFGKINIIIATFFILIIFINEFSILKKSSLRR